jgi:hypothetical protein
MLNLKHMKKQRVPAQAFGIIEVAVKTGAALDPSARAPNNADLVRQSVLAKDIMRKDRLVLRALAK